MTGSGWKTRKFNGITYKMFRWYATKGQAETEADKFRKSANSYNYAKVTVARKPKGYVVWTKLGK